MSELKFYMRSDKFFVVHETENPIPELTVEKIIPYIKVDGTFMYVLKTGEVFYTRIGIKEMAGTVSKEYFECHFHFTNVPLFAPGDKWGFTLCEKIEDVARQFLDFILEQTNKEE